MFSGTCRLRRTYPGGGAALQAGEQTAQAMYALLAKKAELPTCRLAPMHLPNETEVVTDEDQPSVPLCMSENGLMMVRAPSGKLQCNTHTFPEEN
jgi:hypothetical protein